MNELMYINKQLDFFLFGYLILTIKMNKQTQQWSRLSNQSFKKTVPMVRQSNKENANCQSIQDIIRQLMADLVIIPRTQLQMFVSKKINKLANDCSIRLNQVCSLTQLKYIVLGLIERMSNFSHNDFRGTLDFMQTVPQQYTTFKTKKTNIYIDFDFTQMIEQNENKLREKQRLIERLQDMMIDKDNQLEILEEEKQQMKKLIDEIHEQYSVNKQTQSNQISGTQAQIEAILAQNENLKNQMKELQQIVKKSEKEEPESVDEFLRRCLLTQAISIEHFLS